MIWSGALAAHRHEAFDLSSPSVNGILEGPHSPDGPLVKLDELHHVRSPMWQT